MAINAGLVGKSYAPHPYEVSRAKIVEFAVAIGDTSPVYHDVAAATALGHVDVIAPPTFGVVLTRAAQLVVINDPELALDFARVVHGDQKFVYQRPVVAGDKLAVTASIESARTMAGNDILTIRSEVEDADSQPVLTAWATLVARAPSDR